MSSITLKKIIGITLGLIVLDMLLPRTLEFIKPYPSFRRLRHISKKLRSYR